MCRLAPIFTALTLAAVPAFGVGHALAAQGDAKAADTKAPANRPKPNEPAAKKADAGASADAGAPTDAVADAGGKTAGPLPPGHPPTGDELPAGHPPVGGEEEGAAEPEDAPHGGGMFKALPDTAQDDPSLPPGTLIITIKDSENRPIPKAPVALGILHQSAAKGDQREQRTLEADEAGSARVEGLGVSAGTSYRVITNRGPATYASIPFTLTDKAGKRVVLHAYEATSNLEGAMVGMQAFVFVTLREDSISVEHMFKVYNVGKTAWVPDQNGARISLPEGFKAFTKPEGMEDVRFDEAKGGGAFLTGTVTPGVHETTFRYQVPLAGSEKQTFRISLPPRVGEARVFAEASKSMSLLVSGFPEAQRTQGRDGRKVLVTARQAAQGERGIGALEITLAGLPTPGWGRWVAVALAGFALAAAGTYVARLRAAGGEPEEARDDLLEAREALLGEFVALEKARKNGDVGPKTYARLKAALLDALARIETRLEATKAKAKAKAPPAPKDKREGDEREQRKAERDEDRAEEGAS
jgi:hypothetical protein